MRQIYSDDSRLAHSILDAIPAVIIIADSDLTIYDVNTAASGSLELYKDAVFMKRGGEALKCVNSDKVPKGCGHSSACSECILTNTYNEALKGNKVTRNHARMEVRRGDKIVELHLLVTASPFTFEGKQLTLIILEDIAELIKLRSIIPICANCKKIRDDEDFWESVEQYFSERVDVDFSHSICPDCARLLYPELYKKLN